MKRVFNFSAGPAGLPDAVMEKAQQEFTNWHQLGHSIMEMSHRSPEFIRVAAKAEQDLRDLLDIPDEYKVLFCQGGARGQFAAIPLNLGKMEGKPLYINGGYWAKSAIEEAQKYTSVNVIDSKIIDGDQIGLCSPSRWHIPEETSYIHFCPNETIDGLELFELPKTNKPIIADMSSNILSQKIDVSKYDLIYAGAQKNIGPAGLCIVIVKEGLLDYALDLTPSILNYKLLAQKDSMYNTPPTYAWYLSGLVFQWLKSIGGVDEIEKVNQEKAKRLYQAIDEIDFYHNNVMAENRSRMNVPFTLSNPELDELFLTQAKEKGLVALKGHRAAGGMRASIYNAMPLAGVDALVAFMHQFAKKHA